MSYRMDSIASHYAVRKPKPNTTRTVKLLSPPSPQSPKTPARTLKRKAPVQTPTQLGSPFKISQDAPTISESEDQESPLPARKRAKGETPGGKNVTKIPRYLGTPNVPMAGHLHGLSRSVSVKQAAKKPATPRPNDDDEPVTPAKPVALGTPIKAATLLASPTKIRPPSTVISKPTMPSTPSPVKSSVPISVSGFSFRNNSKAPLFPRLGGRTKPELGTPASKVNLSATAPDLENISPRVLFPEQMGIKRRAEDDADSLYPATTATPARKRVRIDIPVSNSLFTISFIPFRD